MYCSENCGIGETSRTRQCTANGEDSCPTDWSCSDDSCIYESKECLIQKCLTCENFANYCDDQVNTECKDVTLANGEITVCSKYRLLKLYLYYIRHNVDVSPHLDWMRPENVRNVRLWLKFNGNAVDQLE